MFGHLSAIVGTFEMETESHDLAGRPNWDRLTIKEVVEELEVIVEHRDRDALKYLLEVTNKWQKAPKALIIEAVDLLAHKIEKPKSKRPEMVAAEVLHAHACNVRAKLDDKSFSETWMRHGSKKRQAKPKLSDGSPIEPSLSLSYLISQGGKSGARKRTALIQFDVTNRLRELVKIYKKGRPKYRKAPKEKTKSQVNFELAERAREHFGKEYFDDNYWEKRR